MIFKIFSALLCVVFLQSLGEAALTTKNDPTKIQEQVENVTMDWTRLRLVGVGHGEPDRGEANLLMARNSAFQSAENDAYQKLMDAIMVLPISAQETVGSRLHSKASLQLQAQKTLRQFKTLDTLYYSHGGMEIEVEVSLLPLLPKILGVDSAAAPKDELPKGSREVYTGLIVDISGLVFYPMFSPRILSEDGFVLYSLERVSGAAILEYGMVGYLPALDAAKKDERTGKKPLVVNALRLEGKDGIVIPSHEARKLRESNLNLDFLAEGRVILVIPSQR